MGFLDSVEQIDEKRPSFFQRFFSHKPTVNLDRLNSVIYQLANQGDGVFLGRGGQILLKSFSCALHVRVIASREKRIQNLIKRGYAEETALRAIEENEKGRIRAEGVVRGVKGVEAVDNHIRVRPGDRHA